MSAADVLALTGDGPEYRWNVAAPLGTPVFVTFAFSSAKPAHDVEARSGFAGFNAEQQADARQALELWAEVSGIRFIEVPESAGGQIRFAMYDMAGMANAAGSPLSGFAYFPTFRTFGGESATVFNTVGGDVFMNATMFAADPGSLAPGQRGFSILIHEIGHALGFKHPFEGSPTIDPAHENSAFTVMSYNRPSSTASLGSVDVEASRFYYGVADAPHVWNAATLELTQYGSEGHDVRLGTELRDIIIGGGGSDTLRGAPGDDSLLAGAGDDVVIGGPGNDVLDGGPGTDVAQFSGLSTRYALARLNGMIRAEDLLAAGDGTDLLVSIERLQFSNGAFAPSALFAPTVTPDAVYRFYNAATGAHFYTASVEERNAVIDTLGSFLYDGPAFPFAMPDVDSQTVPLWRFYNTATSAHFYTASVAEKDRVIANPDRDPFLQSMTFEGPAFQVYAADQPDAMEVWRFYNTGTGMHFYTAAATEKDHIVDNPAEDPYLAKLILEGVAFWVPDGA